MPSNESKKGEIYQQIHMYIDFEAKKLLFVQFSNLPLWSYSYASKL